MIRTWHIETAVVYAVLATVVVATGGGTIEWVGAAAVALSFGHASISVRLAEREAAREVPTVHCHRWMTRYFLAKEALWCAYFLALGAWSALVGVGLFIAYPIWRRYWRRVHPMSPGASL